ncbi:MAG TPA: ABC transporter ATP-binding protein [Saprospiraceae bacterium]|jgi:putative ABC transport system ATP-binding protein|nr:MAG: phosphonate-transporting ATPase [Candidatus Parvibacillus calidus]MCO5284118.1 ABC transporter ATP-binding protein [Saprospiraceae bacterium]MBK7740889.1 ABC transporter ATP-binding protein [Candidatus Parvibacillus calidus]WKZ61792.1 MAG: ABC transporter ATP-binding protein [Saprospiraceae bacterium]HMY85612.1 ABC transporter ATP-binding protein [Saprospiraceae bacterium]
MEIVASIRRASKKYKMGDTDITALTETTLEFHSHELTLILGPSGSGKTTLLSLLGCVIYPTTGDVIVMNQNIGTLKEKKLSRIRLNNIGFVFQGFNLIQPLTALENVMMPLILQGENRRQAKARAMIALEKVDMISKMNNLPHTLSGGQRQRTAIARALVTNPAILLCDEPTASIDSKNASKVMEELKTLSMQGKSVIVVTHDTRLIKYADRIIYLSEGRTSETPFPEEQ